MSGNEIDLNDLKRRMDGAVSVTKSEFASLRTGRASASMLDPITVDAYGSHMPLNQLATIAVPEPRMISVQVWDTGLAAAVDKAIRDSLDFSQHFFDFPDFNAKPTDFYLIIDPAQIVDISIFSVSA